MSAALDPEAILAALGVHDAREITPITDGWGGTSLWRVDRAASSSVLRLFPQGWEDQAERELLAQEAARAAGVPVPEVQLAGAWQGRPALLLAWLPGQIVLQALYAHPAKARALGVRAGRMLARVHAARPPERLRELSGDWITSGNADAALRERLSSLSLRADALLHLDYHPLNVMIHGGRTTGVIDWANATTGDPRADVARALTFLTFLPIPGEPTPSERLTRRHRYARGLLEGYQDVGGPLRDLDLFLVWAGGAMLHDLEPKVGQPGVWLTTEHLVAMRRTLGRWRERAGLPEPGA